MAEKGILYIVGTPIGNLGDITFRALEVLREVDVIAAEDTRNTKKLLKHFGITKKIISYHDYSSDFKENKVLDMLLVGNNIALVSDGGMPLISDPGYGLVKKAIDVSIRVVPIPGPTAFVAALVVSAMPVNSFVFEGYLSRSPSKRRKKIRELLSEKRTIILYESPHRLIKCLKDILLIMGDRDMAIMRELTKKFEEHFYGRVSNAIAYFSSKDVKGEFVLILRGDDL